MENKIIIPPIKSQGIKTKLVPWIMDFLESNKINNNTHKKWIEPFLGTGVVAFNSGFENAILGDTNPHIINFYNELKSGKIDPTIIKDYLILEGSLLSKADNNGYDHFTKVRNRFNTNFYSLDFLFLSRTGFNGMMRFNKKGFWNIPFCKKPNRFSQSYITKITNQSTKVKNVIQKDGYEFHNLSFDKIITLATKDDIIYCDPPYYGRYVDYYNGWSENDEENLFNLLNNTPAKFILSTWHHNNYRKNEMIDKYWNKFNIITKDHFYHLGGKLENRKSMVEALVCNF